MVDYRATFPYKWEFWLYTLGQELVRQKAAGNVSNLFHDGGDIMQGMITKKHFFLILRYFGLRKAMRILFSNNPIALNLLMN